MAQESGEWYPPLAHDDVDLLGVLRRAGTEDLAQVIAYLSKKWSSRLSPDCRNAVAIANEIQRMGGNSIANVYRGHGVTYREIVADVASSVGADLTCSTTIAEKEWSILTHLVKDAEKEMSDKEKEAFRKAAREQAGEGVKGTVYEYLIRKPPLKGLLVILLRYIVPMILRRFGLNAVIIAASPAVAGPIGVAIGAVLIVSDLAGPAYSATIPCVLWISLMRIRQSAEDAASEMGG